MLNPIRPMSVLIVTGAAADAHVMRLGLQESFGRYIKIIDVTNDLEMGLKYFSQTHHDVVLIHGWSSSHSEALVIRIRRQEGSRHTGIICMVQTGDGFDRVVVDNYNAGSDEVVPYNLSMTILRSKMTMVFNYKAMTDMLRTANHKLQTMAVTDELTGCSNMRGFTKRLSTAVASCSAGESGLAIMMMDLDHFKRVNDRYNHLVGSHVIRATGQLLLKSGLIGENDLAARYGGDEFVVLFSGESAATQFEKAQKICSLIADNVFKYDGISLKITASIGIAWVNKGFTGQSSDVVKAADAMLYKSKAQGRNQVSRLNISESEAVQKKAS
ncbi:MAG: GGDEF domain-containing protein [Proteobacteria bacterium]|nr:GGDEF domain-containing protein [Pseudomonadota bacterium]